MTKPVKILLLDNGSLRVEATLLLREIAQQLSERCGQPVDAVSLRHSDRIDALKLGGRPAITFAQYLRTHLSIEPTRFIALPLFFGNSAALTSFVPQQIELLQNEFSAIDLQIAEVVYPLPDGDEQLLSILVDHIQNSEVAESTQDNAIVLVDHGSPSPDVTAVRNHIAQSLSQRLQGKVIDQAVMERREGREYDFNGPMLEQYLELKASDGVKLVIVLLLFFLPGRHAGKGGDIEEICARVCDQYPGLEVILSPLVGEHDGIVKLLDARLQNEIVRYQSA